MVKNYLVCAVRPIRKGWHIEKNDDLYENYKEMYRYRLASFEKFVQEPFEPILWTDAVDDNDNYTVANWNDIKALWHNEPCNIFWAGADTLMVRPTQLFDNNFKEYRLFNYTDPKSYAGFSNYFNDDVQYYPYTMDASVWQRGDELWALRDTHPDRHWGFDQLRHNEMFWSQAIADNDRHHPEMAYQAMNLRSLNLDIVNWHNRWNGIDINQAHILHFHASRGSQQVIELMKNLCNQLGVTV